MKLLVGLAIVLLPVALPAADRLELENGDVISGTIVRLDRTTVVIETEYGRLEIDRSRVARGYLGVSDTPTAADGVDAGEGSSPLDPVAGETGGSGVARVSAPETLSGDSAGLRDGLLMHLPLDGSVADSTGTYLPTNNGMRFVTGASGRANGALRSDGGGTYLSVATDEAVDELDQFTVSFWIRADDTVPTQYLISKWTRAEGQTAEGKFTIQSSRGGITVFLVDQTGRYFWLAAAGALVDGEWQHVAVTFAGGRAGIYVNGDLAATRRFEFDQLYPDNSPLLVMTAEADNEDPFGFYNVRGAIDDLRLYDRALSAGEIAVLAGVSESGQP